MDNVYLLWRCRHRAKPFHQLGGVCMGRSRLQLYYLGPDFNFMPVDANRTGASSQRCATRARRLITSQQDHVSGIARMVLHVV